MLAAVLENRTAGDVANRALERGLIVNAVRSDAIRFAPPLSVSGDEVVVALDRFDQALRG